MCIEKFPRDTNMTDMITSLLLQFQERAEARERSFIGRPIRGSQDSRLLGCKDVTTPKIFSHLSLLKGRRLSGALLLLPYTPSELIARGIRYLLKT